MGVPGCGYRAAVWGHNGEFPVSRAQMENSSSVPTLFQGTRVRPAREASVAPLGLIRFTNSYPPLARWAAFFRRFAARLGALFRCRWSGLVRRDCRGLRGHCRVPPIAKEGAGRGHPQHC
jgi:hypothetical protein